MNAFNWQDQPSIMASAQESRKAAQHAKAVGKLLDSAGRATVNLHPSYSGVELSGSAQADADKRDSIRRGGI